MQPERTIFRIAAKEITLFFSSPIAYLFLAVFAAVTLFTFFWGEAFFSRNIADVRPLFEWMPLLLIFLASTLTMRMWSEERRTGTLEHVLTQPVPLWHFVAGKFLSCLGLLAVALLITLPLPITVAILGDLDWGPVWAGYLATFLLGAAYLSIGLFVSARSENQIVSLIAAVALCALFYLPGTKMMTDFFANQGGEWLRLLGTGSRFDAITRGVIDLRDLYYYLSLIAVFLTLNTFALERERWAISGNRQYHSAWRWLTLLLVANALGANFWLGQVSALRIDATAGNQYSISAATEEYLQQLQEPLLLRAYFSSKTHPLLSPLVPQLRDLMEEYAVAGKGRVRVEIVDPVAEPELEEEANQKYGIQPVPFQVADRYQAAVVNSYFNVLVQYGDEHQVLGFRDLIEVKTRGEGDIDVQLRNPEHDLTRAIKKVLNTYQAGGNLFDTVKGDLVLNAYISADHLLPQQLREFKKIVAEHSEDLQQQSGGRMTLAMLEPEANGGAVAQQIMQDYGFQPMATSLFNQERFYFYLTLAQGDQLVQIPLDDMSKASFERNLASAIKRFASGFTKTLAWVAPPGASPHGQAMSGAQYNQLQAFLGAELNIMQEDLTDGRVSGQADILMLASPKDLDEKQLFALDQFLMQGGTVIAASSPFTAEIGNRALNLQKQTSGLEQWLAHHGLQIEEQLVLDSQNVPFPVPVARNMGGFTVQEIRMLDYPYFVDVRGEGLHAENPITANLPQATLAWASPIVVQSEKQQERKVIELLRSSENSWLSTSTEIMPRLDSSGMAAYRPEGEQKSHLLAVITEGRFTSYFAGKSSPLLTQEESTAAKDTEASHNAASISGVIERSPEAARIILFSSNSFLTDPVIQMAGAAAGGEYLNSLQLFANAVDWSLEDAGLLSIRSRGHFNRTLPAMEQSAQIFWESLNYGLALLALLIVAGVRYQRNRARQLGYQQILAQ